MKWGATMNGMAEIVGAAAALLSAVFWGLGALVRIPSFRRWRLGGEDPVVSIRRQSMMNAIAAVFAATAAVCQAIVLTGRFG